jgi:hypothetical protein
MEILYIKLKNGMDIISNTAIDGNDITLENPMAIKQYADPSGRVLLSFQEWVPSDFVDTNCFIISKDETMVISNTSLRTKEFYKECLQKAEESAEQHEEEDFNEESEDSYSSLVKLLNNQKRILH